MTTAAFARRMEEARPVVLPTGMKRPDVVACYTGAVDRLGPVFDALKVRDWVAAAEAVEQAGLFLALADEQIRSLASANGE